MIERAIALRSDETPASELKKLEITVYAAKHAGYTEGELFEFCQNAPSGFWCWGLGICCPFCQVWDLYLGEDVIYQNKFRKIIQVNIPCREDIELQFDDGTCTGKVETDNDDCVRLFRWKSSAPSCFIFSCWSSII